MAKPPTRKVSIPREDSCFWELAPPALLAADFLFQSPERIHAFGNDTERCLTTISSIVSIPREDSCFWERDRMNHCHFDRILFQSPERIHAFGNSPAVKWTATKSRFNPQRGFMLLGTPTMRGIAKLARHVSIPREDSCFWERRDLDSLITRLKRFNPQRGFMLLGTHAATITAADHTVSIPREDSCFWEHHATKRRSRQDDVSIPREDSCFWELPKLR